MMTQRVLFVDDEPHVTDSLKRVLRGEPYEVLTSPSAAEALALLGREPVDIVVADEKMPGMSGTELLATIRQQHPHIIGMILTGNPTPLFTVATLQEKGVYHCFTKPCDETELALVLRQALQQQELVRKATQLLSLVQRQTAELSRLKKSSMGHPPAPLAEVTPSATPLPLDQLLVAIDALLQQGHLQK